VDVDDREETENKKVHRFTTKRYQQQKKYNNKNNNNGQVSLNIFLVDVDDYIIVIVV
jgi:hypothetical protein